MGFTTSVNGKYPGSIAPWDKGYDWNAASPYVAAAGVGAGLLGTALAKKGRAGQTFSGLASGAATGASIGSMVPGVGTLIGAGVGGLLGAASGMFSESSEEKRAARMDALRKEYADYKEKLKTEESQAIQTGATQIGRTTSGLVRRFKDAGASRAAALGRVGETEAFQLPVAERVANVGSENMSNFVTGTQDRFSSARRSADAALLNAEQQYTMGGEVDAGVPDYLAAVAPEAIRMSSRNQYADIMRRYYN